MNSISRKFTRSQRSVLSFFVMVAIAGSVSLFLIAKANEAIDDLQKVEDLYVRSLSEY